MFFSGLQPSVFARERCKEVKHDDTDGRRQISERADEVERKERKEKKMAVDCCSVNLLWLPKLTHEGQRIEPITSLLGLVGVNTT